MPAFRAYSGGRPAIGAGAEVCLSPSSPEFGQASGGFNLLGAPTAPLDNSMYWIMADFLPMAQEGWMRLTKRLTAMFASMAIANEIVWRTMDTEFWVKFETFALPAALFAFFIAQARMLERYSLEKDDPEA